jgi:hypothetical protein
VIGTSSQVTPILSEGLVRVGARSATERTPTVNELIVPVREDDVHATYLVPLPEFTTVEAATHAIATAAATAITGKRGRKLNRKRAIRLPGLFPALVLSWMRSGEVTISVLQGQDPDGVPGDFPPELEWFLATAPAFAVITSVHPASLLAVQEWRARATAAALAAGLGCAMFELSALRTLDVPTALASLPEIIIDGDEAETRFDVRPWITASAFELEGAYWAVSEGMGYFGLPELRFGGTTHDLRAELAGITRGVAIQIVSCIDPDATYSGPSVPMMALPPAVLVPEVIEVNRELLDIAPATQHRGGDAGVRVRIRLEEEPPGCRWLIVCSPDENVSAESFIGELSDAMFGFEQPRRR